MRGKFHYLTVRRFRTISLSDAKAEMNTTIATYVADLSANETKRTDFSTKVIPNRIYNKNEPMT